jgi:hypothetical protein
VLELPLIVQYVLPSCTVSRSPRLIETVLPLSRSVLVITEELLVNGLSVGDELDIVVKLVRVVAGKLDDGPDIPPHPAAPINAKPTTKTRDQRTT